MLHVLGSMNSKADKMYQFNFGQQLGDLKSNNNNNEKSDKMYQFNWVVYR